MSRFNDMGLPRHPIQSYDLRASFQEGGPGRTARRIIDRDGLEKLDEQLWEAGLLAYEFLREHCLDAISAEGYRHWVKSAVAMLNEGFYPKCLKMIQEGTLHFANEGRADFEGAWAKYDWVEQFNVILAITDQNETSSEESTGEDLWKAYIAVALLWRLDSIVISDFCDGNGLIENVLEVISLRDRLKVPENTRRAIDQAKLFARKEQASKGGAARHAQGRLAREFVESEWLQHRGAYDNNKSAFARDYVKRVRYEFNVEIKEKQMREVWLKDTPPAGKQAGEPAHG